MIEPVILKYRAFVSDLRGQDASLAAVDRGLNDHRATLWELNREIERIAPALRSPFPTSAGQAQERLAHLRSRAEAEQAEIDRLTTARERLQARRDGVSALVANCRTFLMERHGVPRGKLEG